MNEATDYNGANSAEVNGYISKKNSERDAQTFYLNTFDKNKLVQAYHNDGVFLVSDFLDASTLNDTINEIHQMEKDAELELKEKWGDEKVFFFSRQNNTKNPNAVDFATTQYFKQSHDKVHVFYEVVESTQEQKEQNTLQRRINRIGHGLHLFPNKYPAIHSTIYKNDFLKQFLQSAGYKRPICHLSVYIPKHGGGVGSRVLPHQENTFANTSPPSCFVLWVALEDATLDNACMWCVPGSHTSPLRLVSKVDHVSHTREMVKIDDTPIPDQEKQPELFSPLQVKAGGAALFHGNLFHSSFVNSSDRSRKAITFQFLETEGVEYTDFNWIKTPNHHYLYSL
ncbi:phytanoyl-CoA hydroxylase [Acrasis kona]|uniref:Phytanoyl-CoA hydroxylase n=1 Tax=Acrasis kona TaxID=1008807 RepID=A0AAW2Z265_9EUKA